MSSRFRYDPLLLSPRAMTYFAVWQTLNREVFAELPQGELGAAELLFPVPVGIHLVYEDRSMLTVMAGKLALAIAIHVEAPDHPPRTASFHALVNTLPPRHETSRGRPTFTDNSRAIFNLSSSQLLPQFLGAAHVRIAAFVKT